VKIAGYANYLDRPMRAGLSYRAVLATELELTQTDKFDVPPRERIKLPILT
jgi:hypothetical protein